MQFAALTDDTASINDPASTNETVDPVAVAIEAYIEGTAGSGAGNGFPWVAVIALALVVVAVFVGAVVLRRRFA
jgi:hypothetical protein